MHLCLPLWYAMWMQVFSWARLGSSLSYPMLCQRAHLFAKAVAAILLQKLPFLALTR